MNYYLYNTETVLTHNKVYMSVSNKNNEKQPPQKSYL